MIHWWVYLVLGAEVAAFLVMLFILIRTNIREPIFNCRNCKQVIGPNYPNDTRTKAEIRRDHEKVCFP